MTEQRIAELLVGLQAHRLQLVRASADMAEVGNLMADLALRFDRMRLKEDCEMAMRASSTAARLAHELALGLERIDRMAEPDLADTQPLDLDEIAKMNAEDAKDP